MLIKLSKNKDYVLLIPFLLIPLLILILPTFVYANAIEEAPYLNKSIEQQMIYPYTFEEVWEYNQKVCK